MSDIPRKSVETLFIRIANQSLALLASILVARMLGPHGKGVLAYIGSVSSVLATLGTGQSSAIARQYGRLGQPSGAVFRAMMLILAFGGTLIALIVAGFALGAPSQRPLIAVAIALPFSLFSTMSIGFFLADGKVRVVNGQMLVSNSFYLVALGLLLLVFHLGLTAAIVVWVSAPIIAALYSAFMLKPYVTRSHGESHGGDPKILREQVTFGLRVSANAIVALLNFRVDVFIILFLLGTKSLGIYSIAIGVGELMWQLSRPLGVSAFSVINSGSRAQATHMAVKCVRHTLAMVSGACLLLFFAGPALITLVYGHAFAGAGIALRFLLPGIIAYSMVPFFNGFFVQQIGKVNQPLVISGVSALLCALITFATVRHWGIAGGAFATSVTYMGALVANALLFRKETGVPIKAFFTFGREDVRPYKTLLASIWNRAAALAAGKRN